jgi:hypothetical protein
LRFLAGGARAFVGCTGAHYSPREEPFGYFGGPFHQAFWRRIARGEPPASALFETKRDYLEGIPHRRQDPLAVAIERKIWHQFTCLGLGW